LFKRFAAPVAFKDGESDADQGLIEAVVSTFGVLDADREIVMASAFTDGQALPMVWAHDWARPIGKGIISVQPDRAVFSGRLFLDTTAGLDAFRTMKAMGDLQQFSWGFGVKRADFVEQDGEQVRRILETEAYEVSPVLVGSNPQTGILAIKSSDAKYMGGGDAPDGSYEALSQDLEAAFRAQRIPAGTDGWCYVLATWGTHFIACLTLSMSDEMTYWDVPYVLSADGAVTLGQATEVDEVTTFVPAKAYDQHAARVESDVRGFLERSRAGSATRAKEGRAISTARRERMATVSGSLRTAADEIDAMLTETAPPEPAKAIDVGHELAAFLAFEARRNGVGLTTAGA